MFNNMATRYVSILHLVHNIYTYLCIINIMQNTLPDINQLLSNYPADCISRKGLSAPQCVIRAGG